VLSSRITPEFLCPTAELATEQKFEELEVELGKSLTILLDDFTDTVSTFVEVQNYCGAISYSVSKLSFAEMSSFDTIVLAPSPESVEPGRYDMLVTATLLDYPKIMKNITISARVVPEKENKN